MKYFKNFITAPVILFFITASAQEARLMRFPTIYNNQVVFSYAGDLYTVDKSGGTARKLTSDIGYEMFSRFSPDGKNIAFTGQYDGNTEIYIMPAAGGSPKRITYTATLNRDDIADRMGPNNITMTWKDNDHIVYRSRKKTFDDFVGSLYVANINGGLSDELPLPDGGFSSFSRFFNIISKPERQATRQYSGLIGSRRQIWLLRIASMNGQSSLRIRSILRRASLLFIQRPGKFLPPMRSNSPPAINTNGIPAAMASKGW